jgi:ankyrin repeat protein
MKKSFSIASFILVRLLIHVGIGFAACADFSSMSSKELNNALISAVKKNKPETVQELVQAGADVNKEMTITGSHGRGEGCMDYMIIYTLLEYAAIHGYVDIVKELINAGAVIYADHPQYSDYAAAALIGASRKGHVDVVRALIKAGADVNHADRGDTALCEASRGGHVDVVKELIRAGADVDHVGILGTALIGASRTGYVDVIKELIKAGADVNFTNEYGGDTALIQASIRGYADVVRELIKAGAHVNLTNKNGDTALMCAIKNHHFDVVQSILQSPEFHTGIWQRIKDLFSDSGTKSINYADKDGNTALILAIQRVRCSYSNNQEYNICVNSQNIINALLQTPGINLHHVNKNGDTAITLLEKLNETMNRFAR